MLRQKTFWALVLIIFFGAVIRLYRISDNSLYGDELTLALDTFSILKTGNDQRGNFFPLTFPMRGSSPPGYVYLSLPFIAIFGANEVGIRLLSVLSGLGLIILIYFLSKRLFSEGVGLIASALLAISPWDISLSRAGFETHLALFLSVLGVYLFLLKKKNLLKYILAPVFFGLAMFTYPTYKMTIPFFVPILVYFIGVKTILKKENVGNIIGSLLIVTLFLLLLIFQVIGGSEQRFARYNIFADKSVINEVSQSINDKRKFDILPGQLSSIFHNKIWEYNFLLVKNYINNFSGEFLFINGDENPRHNMSEMGELYWVEILTLILGVICLAKTQKLKLLSFLILWLCVSPIAGSMLGKAHALRSSFMIPPLVILSSLGFHFLYISRSKIARSFLAVIFFILFIQMILMLEQIFFVSPRKFTKFWSGSAKLVSGYILKNRQNYNYVLVSDRIDNIEYAYPLYGKIEPLAVIAQNREKIELLDYGFKKYDNVYLGDLSGDKAIKLFNFLEGRKLLILEYSEKPLFANGMILEDRDFLPNVLIYER